MSGGLAITLFALTTLLYVALAVLRGQSAEEIFTALLACGGYTIVLFTISVTGGKPIGDWRLVASALNVSILLATLGDPARMFDPEPMKAKTLRRLPKEARRAHQRREAQIADSQVAFLGLMTLGVILFAVLDLDVGVR